MTPAAEAVCVPAHLVLPGSSQAKQLCQLHAQLSQGQNCHRQKQSCVYAQGHFGPVRPFATLWTVACQAAVSGRGFSRQEYCSVLAAVGCHVLLEHRISCCPSCQPPEYLVLPEPLRPKQPHHLHAWPSQGQTQVLQGSLRSKPQWRTPRAEVEIESQLKPRGSVAKEEDPNLPTSCTSGRLNPQDPLRRLCVHGDVRGR